MHLPLFFEYNLKFIWDILVFLKNLVRISLSSHIALLSLDQAMSSTHIDISCFATVKMKYQLQHQFQLAQLVSLDPFGSTQWSYCTDQQ